MHPSPQYRCHSPHNSQWQKFQVPKNVSVPWASLGHSPLPTPRLTWRSKTSLLSVSHVRTYRRLWLCQHWRKRPWPTLRGMLVAISRGGNATDGRGQLRTFNGVRSFDMVCLSRLDFSICDTNFAFFSKSQCIHSKEAKEEAGHSFGREYSWIDHQMHIGTLLGRRHN